MPKQLRPLTAEFVGTLLFVFVGAGSVVASVGASASGAGIGSLGVALAHGVGMAIIVSMTMSISGAHLNPAVTFGLWIADKIDGGRAGQYVLAQLLGALAGAALVKVLLPRMAVALALVAWQWNAHAVYWIGPLIGAGVAGALWKAILLPRA